MSTFAALADYFDGNWRFARIMTDLAGSSHGHAIGLSSFMRVGRDMLAYHEDGYATYGGLSTRHPFYRDYTYHFSKDRMTLYHASGPQDGMQYQAYLQTKNGRWQPDIPHLCGVDNYESVYDFKDKNCYILSTSIKGPRKNKTIKTRFERL